MEVLTDHQQKITEKTVGNVMEALDVAGVSNVALKTRIKKLIYWGAEAVAQEAKGEAVNVNLKGKGVSYEELFRSRI
jgi:hypothetical protein